MPLALWLQTVALLHSFSLVVCHDAIVLCAMTTTAPVAWLGVVQTHALSRRMPERRKEGEIS